MKALVNLVLGLWAIVVLAMLVKFISVVISSNFYYEIKVKNKNTEIIRQLKEIKVFTKNNYVGCEDRNGRSVRKTHDNSNIDEIGSVKSCKKNLCNLKIEYRGETPPLIGVYLRKNNKCILQNFTTKDNVKIRGYYVDLKLTPKEMNSLNIDNYKQIVLTNSTRQTVYAKHQYYDYGEKRIGDTISYNNKIVGNVIFNPNKVAEKDTSEEENNKKIKENEIKEGYVLNIPDKDLFTFDCNKDYTYCKRTSNYTIINADGYYVAVGHKFMNRLFYREANHKKPSKYANNNLSKEEMDDTMSLAKGGTIIFYDKPSKMKDIIKKGINYNISFTKKAKIMNEFRAEEADWDKKTPKEKEYTLNIKMKI